MKKSWMIFTYGILTMLFVRTSLSATAPQSIVQEKKQFINGLIQKDHFDQKKINALFKKLHKNNDIVSQMHAPFEKESWAKYKSFFITPTRINLGVKYWQSHHDILTKIEKTYGVPAPIIIAIIGVETAYGTHMGSHSIANTLYTLAFYYPARSHYFKKELREYFLLTRENNLDPLKLKGSYAGALGIPQFMPSSYRYYGVSASDNNKVDLFQHQNDAVASVANYLKKNGWSKNKPIAKKISKIQESLNSHLIVFKENATQVTWRVFHNFKVILSYNHSPSYAMVVYQLSQAIQEKYAFSEHQKASRAIAQARTISRS